MRSEVVFQAIKKIDGRYQLCGACVQGTRELHIGSRRIEDTINAVLIMLGAMDPSRPESLHLSISRLP